MRKNNLRCVMFVVCILCSFMLLNSSCDNNSIRASYHVVGGPCEYDEIHGTATITWTGDPVIDADNCKNAIEIKFTFTPDDPSARNHYRFPDWSDENQRFTVGGGKNPPKNWAVSRGLMKGSSHECVRLEIINGTCTPVIFSFPDIDLRGWEDECF